jgi:ubiquinone/menaquinone biosynthesis C-methylase UbiE
MGQQNYPKTRGRDLNHVAWLYDPVIENLSFGKERLFRELSIKHMAIIPSDRILDVGCGTGSLTLLIAGHLASPGEVIGIDAAPKMIEQAKSKAAADGSNAKFAVGISEALDLQDSQFDMVVNSMFTHHIDLELKKLTFSEMLRVLKPGGRLITADIDRPTTFWGWIMGWGARYLLIQQELEDNLKGLLPALMKETGFTDIRKIDHVHGLVSFFSATKPLQ